MTITTLAELWADVEQWLREDGVLTNTEVSNGQQTN